MLNVSYAPEEDNIQQYDPCTKCQRSFTVLVSGNEGLLYSQFPF